MTTQGIQGWRRGLVATALACAFAAWRGAPVQAAEQWIEVRSPHFIVTSNAGQGNASNLAWQLEQVRSAIAALWPWARVDLNKPLVVLAVKDEASMKTLAPEYWERKGAVHPVSVWVGGADQNYLAIRTDASEKDTVDINPYVYSYFSYVLLVLQQSATRELPVWFNRGLAGVLSNTIVRESKLLLGPPIPWHLERLRTGIRLKVPALIAVASGAPELATEEGLRTFDAESWALVHFLMFGENGARWPSLDRFSNLVARGTDPDVAFRETLGRPEDLDTPFAIYTGRSLFSYRQVNVDASVKRDGFVVRPLPAADAASRRALFHVAMKRPVEARAAIAEARKGDAAAPEASVAEALLLDAEGKTGEAAAAFGRAIEAGSLNAYAHYRFASLTWRPDADRDTLERVEKSLARAVNLNNRDAHGYAFLAQVRSVLGIGDPAALARRAISLEPAESHHHLTLAFVLARARQYEEAAAEAQTALALAKTADARRQATDQIESITRSRKGSGG